MNKKPQQLSRIILMAFMVTLLTACSTAGGDPSALPKVDEPVTQPTSDTGTTSVLTQGTPAAANLAQGKEIIAASFLPGEAAENAVDGNLNTTWNAGANPPQWIQLDLGGSATVKEIRLTIAQYPDGRTTHQIFSGLTPDTLTMVKEFSGMTNDGQVLVFQPENLLKDTRYIKILTTESPSWTAWREISVMGGISGIEDNAAPSNTTADLILYNGEILTMNDNLPLAKAIAIQGDKILAIGEETEVMRFKGENTELIDLNGLTLTPGFIDSHSHRVGDRWHFGEVSAEQMLDKAIKQGWTSIHELFVHDQRLEELVSLAQLGILPLRVSMYLTMNFHDEYTTWWKSYHPLQNFGPYLQVAGLKITLDQDWGKTIFFDQQELNQMVLDGQSLGWQIAVHSFTTTSNGLILEAFSNASSETNYQEARHRIEHIGVITDEQILRMADLGIIGSVQFINASSWIEDKTFKEYIPKDDIQHTARWRDLINAGVFLIGNTDDPWCCTDWINEFNSPPEEATVMEAIYQGVTRTTFTGKIPENWQISQAVTVEEALKMLTIYSAYAGHQEDKIGSLEPGKLADMVVLSNNPLDVPVGDLPEIEVLMTMVGGVGRYCSIGLESLCANR